LPVNVFGSSSTNSIFRGYAYADDGPLLGTAQPQPPNAGTEHDAVYNGQHEHSDEQGGFPEDQGARFT